MAVGAAIVSPLAPTVAARIGARTTVAGGLAVAGLGFLSLYALPPTYPVVLLALTLLGVGASSLAIASAIIMSGTPPEKAGNAAAAEETAYDLGNVLGVAVLGSAASVAYRAHLEAGVPGVPVGAEESLGAALEIAAETGTPELAARAEEAFTNALAQTGLFGGLIMIATAVAVFLLLPKNTGLDGNH
ncbi:MFS transporter, DHA2 family, multidrug resistance protein [Saccharopolyspora antimicrobica]|uniref:DHA2 family multidrug resistance protein-like MFS transporter n=1 Tax=Saccharopolyspora antimicrobica TaxID=455193 RepID=A0A1I5FJM4_9PSEU|nr:DHA2 family multidrug resistance protein-like MFS transporter [Saccharopolyspora antimicrobica]SFO23511.1 MFS transporter, DHA2 family, multidrug resistance protein [Saccharopolyspora antimicrobica]